MKMIICRDFFTGRQIPSYRDELFGPELDLILIRLFMDRILIETKCAIEGFDKGQTERMRSELAKLKREIRRIRRRTIEQTDEEGD